MQQQKKTKVALGDTAQCYFEESLTVCVGLADTTPSTFGRHPFSARRGIVHRVLLTTLPAALSCHHFLQEGEFRSSTANKYRLASRFFSKKSRNRFQK